MGPSFYQAFGLVQFSFFTLQLLSFAEQCLFWEQFAAKWRIRTTAQWELDR